MDACLVLLSCLGTTVILVFVVWGICDLINYIKTRKWKKWKNFCFATYPELKEMLSEYRRTRQNTLYTIRKIEETKTEITKQIEENKYLPKGDRVDGYIETLKEKYIWLKDLLTKQREEENEKKAELDNFWEINFPNLREDKRIMWLD